MNNQDLLINAKNELLRIKKKYIVENLEIDSDSLAVVEIPRSEFKSQTKGYFSEVSEDGKLRYYTYDLNLDDLNDYSIDELFLVLKELKDLEAASKNRLTAVLNTIGFIIIFLGILSGFAVVEDFGGIGVAIIILGITNGVLFFALGEIIKLLHQKSK